MQGLKPRQLVILIMLVIALTVFLRTKFPHETIADGGKFFGALFYSLVNVMFNGMAELAMTVDRLPVFYKQRDLIYPPWAFRLSYWLLKIPLSLLESRNWNLGCSYLLPYWSCPCCKPVKDLSVLL